MFILVNLVNYEIIPSIHQFLKMDLKEVFGVYGKPHRMFVQAMLTRGMVPSNELKKLFDLGVVHVIFEVF